MASRSAQTQRNPIQIALADGSFFVCPCGVNELRATNSEDEPLHLFCRCGQVYTVGDLPPLAE